MPSLRSRSVDVSAGYVRSSPQPIGISAGPQPITSPGTGIHGIPTPPPIHVTRSPWMVSSVPSLGQSGDGTVRQFYSGRNLPVRRVIAL